MKVQPQPINNSFVPVTLEVTIDSQHDEVAIWQGYQHLSKNDLEAAGVDSHHAQTLVFMLDSIYLQYIAEKAGTNKGEVI